MIAVPDTAAAPDASPSYATSLPPGPATPPVLLTLQLARSSAALLERCTARYGDSFTLRLMQQRVNVVFAHPDAIREIFEIDPEDARAGEATRDILEPILGSSSLLVLDGARHLRERRRMSPPFHGERMQVYGRLMREITDEVIDHWTIGQPFPVQAAMQAITLDVIVRAVFGIDDAARLTELRARLLRFLALADGPAAAFIAVPALQIELGGLAPWGRFVRYRRAVDEILFEEIARRRRDGTAGRTDILSLLADARDERGEGMTDQELRDEMFTLLMAGHETTATSLAWAFLHLLPRRDMVERVRDELHGVTRGGPIESHHVAQLPYLDAVIKECARLTPVVSFLGRRLRVPTRIGGHDLPAGVIAAPCIYLAHRHPAFWPDPRRFDPRRFLDTKPNPFAFFPFGGSVRRCLGAAFATYEMKIVLAQVLRRTTLRILPGYRMRPVTRAITTAPSRGMPVVLERMR